MSQVWLHVALELARSVCIPHRVRLMLEDYQGLLLYQCL